MGSECGMSVVRPRRSRVAAALDGFLGAIRKLLRLFRGKQSCSPPTYPDCEKTPRYPSVYEVHAETISWLKQREAFEEAFEARVLELLAPVQQTLRDLAQERRGSLPEYTALPPPPADLPPPPQLFYGRDDELTALGQSLTTRDQPSVVLCGPAGIGKSTLAMSVLHSAEVVAHYGSRRFLVRCLPSDGEESMLSRFAAVLGVSGGDLSSPAESSIVTALRTCPFETLIVLDGTDHLLATPSIRSLLDALWDLPRISLLIAARSATHLPQSFVSGSQIMHLAPLTLASARALFQAVSDADANDAIEALLAYADGIPGVVVELAQRAQYEPSAFLLADCRAEGDAGDRMPGY